MSEELRCNASSCRKLLDSFAWVTFCSHIFCQQHGVAHFSKLPNFCPVCEASMTSKNDVIRIDLDPSEQFKNMILAGLKPDTVLDISGRAISFWNCQMEKEKQYQQENVERLKCQMIDLESYYEGVLRNSKHEMSSLRRQNEGLQRERDNLVEQKENATAKLTEKNRQNKKLKTMYETIRRRGTTSNTCIPLQPTSIGSQGRFLPAATNAINSYPSYQYYVPPFEDRKLGPPPQSTQAPPIFYQENRFALSQRLNPEPGARNLVERPQVLNQNSDRYPPDKSRLGLVQDPQEFRLLLKTPHSPGRKDVC